MILQSAPFRRFCHHQHPLATDYTPMHQLMITGRVVTSARPRHDIGLAWRVMDDSCPYRASGISGLDLQRDRRHLQQEWLAASARWARNAEDALLKATAVVTEDIPGRPPDVGLATAWAAIGEGWAVLAAAEATRSAASAVMPVEETRIG